MIPWFIGIAPPHDIGSGSPRMVAAQLLTVSLCEVTSFLGPCGALRSCGASSCLRNRSDSKGSVILRHLEVIWMINGDYIYMILYGLIWIDMVWCSIIASITFVKQLFLWMWVQRSQPALQFGSICCARWFRPQFSHWKLYHRGKFSQTLTNLRYHAQKIIKALFLRWVVCSHSWSLMVKGWRIKLPIQGFSLVL